MRPEHQTFDAVDGKQEKWMNSSSLLDHGWRFDIFSFSNELGESSNIRNSNSEEELTSFFSSLTMKKLLEGLVIQTFDRVLKPMLENSILKAVMEHIFLKSSRQKWILYYQMKS